MTSDKIANRDKKEETPLSEFFPGYMEPATELLALPQRVCAHHTFHLCIAIIGFTARLFKLKSGCYSRTLM